MLALINTNIMQPPIAPIGLDYVGTAARQAGIEVKMLDLCLAADPDSAIKTFTDRNDPSLVALTFRNVDDCFWPSAQWFVPSLAETIRKIRSVSDAPIGLGGIGFSIFSQRLMEYTHADFGIFGDGEKALTDLYSALRQGKGFDSIEGLLWQDHDVLRKNGPAWPQPLSIPTQRDMVDNRTYFERGGQIGIETKRGCNRKCIYCADPIAKGPALRVRNPVEVADEFESLLRQGIDVFHLCDSEFNIPYDHAIAVCREIQRRKWVGKVRWYTYMAVIPFDETLASEMRRAGCAGINFTSDSACPAMLRIYRQPHGKQDLARAVRLCRENGIRVMLDLLLGGPGETPETVSESIAFFKQIDPDCVGAGVGLRIYPGTEAARLIEKEGNLGTNPAIQRKYDGPVDFFQPTFYISPALGGDAAGLVRELIGDNERFFSPMSEAGFIKGASGEKGKPDDHNYNDNQQLIDAIAAGARGAYWDILRQIQKKRM
ncbi:MAG: radical SAM protein [Sedimentisphaerales bacterium]|nr:radical SAM protein [Sedimentisphaerales bacterium]